MQVRTYIEANKKPCKYNTETCNSFVKLFINEDKVIQTLTKVDRKNYDPQITYTTGKIPKNNATIKIEVWDASSEFFEKDALIQRTEGNIDSFLNEPIRLGVKADEYLQNTIETMSFWRDEYEHN